MSKKVIILIILLFSALFFVSLIARPRSVFPSSKTPILGYKIVNIYPHDQNAFTQGLIFHDGNLYESTGLRGKSTLRKVDLETGKVMKQYFVDDDYFAEGLTIFNDQLIQLTWKNHIGFRYDINLNLLNQFPYPKKIREGWGLTHDGKKLIMSDGTDALHFLKPQTFELVKSLQIRDGNHKPVKKLNELEFIDGEIYANIYMTNRIAKISPTTGRVLAFIDLTGLDRREDAFHDASVLNGIAYDAKRERLFVTGKNWSHLYEIELTEK